MDAPDTLDSAAPKSTDAEREAEARAGDLAAEVERAAQERAAEVALVARATTDPEAFAALYDTHYDRILNYCIRRTGSVAAGADLCAETFLKALTHLHRYRPTGAPFSAWLYRIAGNCIVDYQRGLRHRGVSLDHLRDTTGFEARGTADVEAEITRAEEALLLHRAYRDVQAALVTLDGKYQEALALRFFEGKKLREICEITGKNENTVKSLIKRGLDAVRKKCTLPEGFTL